MTSARMNSAVFDWNAHCPIVAILRGVTPREAPSVGASLLDCGIDVIEVPLNSPRPYESLRKLSEAFSGVAIIGAGTVLCVDGVMRAADAGAQFVVSPNMDPDVIDATLTAGLASMPGVMSPSEAFAAVRAGANALKIFPAGALGPGYVRDLRAVLPDQVALFAVGGVGLDNVREWNPAGAQGIGVGSGLYRPGDTPERVKRKARAFMQAIKGAGREYESARRTAGSGR